ncbi:Cef1 protein [Pichia kluyveri]|uniref:Pre-mRNA-splicing factor CEF1 n=1 Tax=Pichia kluyveri TaxID=36015 RepID=A0AAV5R7I6_PICKL|nr:Cef1 protein [Pichia kluyveri]
MAPVYVKGGMWTNVEDEILKAAIAKYGLNQWSRVSSLLTRKNAKQCKLRWQEWLDPRIKKLDWSPEEDKRLLNLAKLRPNQWSSISLLLNRTANQCIERYQELISNSDVSQIEDGEKSTANRLLLTGNVESGQARGTGAGNSLGGLNLNPESKPARPDLDVDNEDEKEMISEAKARLANTQGKKAKRKARERLLEESKNVTELLRRRELKQVGIDRQLKYKKHFKDEMDYNADIAFERRPEAGIFDTSEELKIDIETKDMFDKRTKIQGTFNQEVEIQKRKDKKRKEQNKKLNEKKKNTSLSKPKLVDEGDDSNYLDELSKRRKLVFKENKEINEDLDQLIVASISEMKERNSGKSGMFSRKRLLEDATQDMTDFKDDKIKQKEAKRRKKQLKHKINEKLESLPAPVDDFEIDVNLLMTQDMIINDDRINFNDGIDIIKQKPQVIIDDEDKRRNQNTVKKELRKQIEEIETLQSIKEELPLIHRVEVNDNDSELDKSLKSIINEGRLVNLSVQKGDSVETMKNTLNVWNEVQEKINIEMGKIKKESTNKYEKQLERDERLENDVQKMKQYCEENLQNFINDFKTRFENNISSKKYAEDSKPVSKKQSIKRETEYIKQLIREKLTS